MSALKRIMNQITNTTTTLVQLFGTDKTASKVRIDAFTSLTISSVWQAVNVIAGGVAQLPLITYERDQNGNRDRATKHSVYQLLKRRPNRFMTALQFKMTLQSHVLLWGNAYAHIQRDVMGNPIAMYPLLPHLTRPVVDERGNLTYETQIGPEGYRKFKVIKAQDVLHLRGLGFDGLQGYSVVSMARESFGLAKAAERHGATYFGNYATPQGILKVPGPRPTNEQMAQTKADWKKLNSGDNEHDVAVLYGGMEFTPMSMSNKDSQFLESRQFNRSEVASWFNLPPHKVGDLSRATFSNIEEQNSDYLNTSLMFWLCVWQEECGDKLLSDKEKEEESHYMEFNTAALLRGNTKSRYESYAIGVTNGWVSRNEVRQKENLNRVDGLDEFLVPLNMGKSSEDKTSDDNNDEEQKAKEEISRIIRSAIKPLIKLEINRVKEKAKTAKNFCESVEDFYSRFHKTVAATVCEMGCQETSVALYCKGSCCAWLELAGNAKTGQELQELIDTKTQKLLAHRMEALLTLILQDRDNAKNQAA